MKRHWCAALAMMALTASLSNAATAKPVDLPAQQGIECPDGSDDPVGQRKFSIELGLGPKGITLKMGLHANPEVPMNIDTLTPAFVEHCLQHLGDMLARPDRFVGLDAVLSKLRQFHGASFASAKANVEANAGNCRQHHAKAERAQKARATLESRLFEPVNVRIKNVPLKQALKNVAHRSGIVIVPDHRDVLEAVRVDLDTPVSVDVENTSVHSTLQQLLAPLGLTFVIENDVVMVTTPERGSRGPAERNAERKNVEAQRIFEIAERHRRSSDFDVARKLYQQVHLLTPTTLHGRMAIVRIVEIEEQMRDTSEEQGLPIPGRPVDPEQVYRDMRTRTVPLGLVEVSH